MDKASRLRPHETQWGRSPGLTMIELRNIGNRMCHPLTPDQQRHIGQISIMEEAPEFLAEAMEVKDNPSNDA